jgi:glutamate racemase
VPDARLLYFADTAHVPYGDKTPAQIRHYALSISEFLFGHGAELVVFACNTTSAYALKNARERFEKPVIGVIEPGARVASAVSEGAVGVLATAATVQSQVYTHVLRGLRPELQVREIGCPAFVPLVEARRADTLEAKEACKHYMAPLLRAGVDTVILGCTHYPLLLPILCDVAPHIRFVDPAEAVAEEVAGALSGVAHSEGEGVGATPHTFFVSGPQDGVHEWVNDLLNIDHPNLQPGPIFDLEPQSAL